MFFIWFNIRLHVNELIDVNFGISLVSLTLLNLMKYNNAHHYVCQRVTHILSDSHIYVFIYVYIYIFRGPFEIGFLCVNGSHYIYNSKFRRIPNWILKSYLVILSHSTKLITKTDLIDPRFGEIQVINRTLESEWNSSWWKIQNRASAFLELKEWQGRMTYKAHNGTSTSLVELS